MKRAITGGAHRGPLAPTRQRRTLRFMQVLLVLVAVALLVFAGYSLGRVNGFDAGRRSSEVGGPAKPSAAETIVLLVLGAAALGGAIALQSPEGVRMPTPARLEELAGRAEKVAIERAEEIAESNKASAASETSD